MRRVLSSLAALTALLASPALAEPGELGLGFKTTTKGKEPPSLQLAPSRAIKSLSVTLTDHEGRSQTLRSGPIAARGNKALTIKQGFGQASYQAKVEVTWADGQNERFELDFEATRLDELKLSIPAETVDLEGRQLVASVNNPIQALELRVLGESGELIHEVRETFDPPAAPHQAVTLSWPELSQKPLSLDIKATDVGGFWTGLRLTPFFIEIPHEEVVFDSGKAVLRSDQHPKLQKTWEHIQSALSRYGTLLDLKLFIAGYTDTVGDRASNRALSAARAQAIANWFQQQKLRVPVYYAGFGEDALAVQTPDETEEPANRRALYLLSVNPPTGSQLPNAQWQALGSGR